MDLISLGESDEIERLLRHLRWNHDFGRPVDLAQADAPAWIASLERLIDCGDLAVARTAAVILKAGFPAIGFFHVVAAAMSKPPRKPSFFTKPPITDVELLPHPGADTLLISFLSHHTFAPVLRKHLASFEIHVLFINDIERRTPFEGIRSLGPDRPGSIATLKRIAKILGANRILCMGFSYWGYTALDYGLDLGAEAVVAFSGFTTFTRFFEHAKSRAERRLGRPATLRDFEELNMRGLFEKAVSPPRTLLVYPGNNPQDVYQAENMMGLPTLTLKPIPEAKEHNIQVELVASGAFNQFMSWLVRSTPIH